MPAWSATPSEAEPPALARREAGRHADGGGHVGEPPTLLDVHLDPGGQPLAERRGGAKGLGRDPARGGEVAQRVAVGVAARQQLVGIELAGEGPGAVDREAEARALLVDDAADRQTRRLKTKKLVGAPTNKLVRSARARRAASTATSPATTPRAPSNAPPPATVSTCEPVAIQGASSAPGSTAHRFAAGSCTTSRPSASAVRANQARAASSPGPQASRCQPASVRPIADSSACRRRNSPASITRRWGGP